MHLFAGLFLWIFGQFAAFFVKFMVKKTAFAAAAITTFALLTISLFATMQALLGGLLMAFPITNPILSSLTWTFVPPTLIGGLSAIIAADTAVTLYRWNVENLKLAAYIT